MSSKQLKSKSIRAPEFSEQYQAKMDECNSHMQVVQESLNSVNHKKSSRTSFETALKVKDGMRSTEVSMRMLKYRLVLEKRRLATERDGK